MREHRDIAEFEARTKIRAKYLRALEDEEWGLLPGYTFTKAFLRTYADMLGLDGRMLVDEFKRQYQDPSELELAPVQPARGEPRRSRERTGERGGGGGRGRRPAKGPSSRVLAVALLVLLLAAALFVVRELSKNNKKTPARTTSSTTSSSSSRSHSRTAPPRVGVALVPVTAVHVCLIGYRTAHGGAHQRVNAVLRPASGGPVYHADNHFLVSFTGGTVRMVVNGRSVTVGATAATAAYEIYLDGHSRKLAASAAPRCT